MTLFLVRTRMNEICPICKTDEWESEYCETQHNHIHEEEIVCCRCFCKVNGDIPCPDGRRYRDQEYEERSARIEEEEEEEEDKEEIFKRWLDSLTDEGRANALNYITRILEDLARENGSEQTLSQTEGVNNG